MKNSDAGQQSRAAAADNAWQIRETAAASLPSATIAAERAAAFGKHIRQHYEDDAE